MSILVTLAGWLGAAALLCAYALVSSRKLDSDGTRFQLMNILGAAGLAANSGMNGAWASAVLNFIWIAIGLVTAYRRALAARARSGAGR